MLDKIAELVIFGFVPLAFGMLAGPANGLAGRERPGDGPAGYRPPIIAVSQQAGVDRAQLVGHDWLIDFIAGVGTQPSPKPTFAIDASGHVAGKGPCNSYFGTAEFHGSSVAFKDIGATRMACAPAVMAKENALFNALGKATSFRSDHGQLVLVDGRNHTLLRLSGAA